MWSGDSTTTPDELEQAVIESALDVLCITDHNAIRGAVEMAERLACRVVIGEEVKSHAGELIGLFVTDRVPFGLPAAEVAKRIRGQGGLVYIPHPFDPLRNCLREEVLYDLVEQGLVDAIEGRNGKTSLQHLNERAMDFANEAGLPVGGGSDAHVPDALGAVYSEMPDFDGTPESFLEALRGGTVTGHHYDAPRRWRPRIVPSTSVG
jgi:predicted metal-dependent phosphoesterase TrpH